MWKGKSIFTFYNKLFPLVYKIVLCSHRDVAPGRPYAFSVPWIKNENSNSIMASLQCPSGNRSWGWGIGSMINVCFMHVLKGQNEAYYFVQWLCTIKMSTSYFLNPFCHFLNHRCYCSTLKLYRKSVSSCTPLYIFSSFLLHFSDRTSHSLS